MGIIPRLLLAPCAVLCVVGSSNAQTMIGSLSSFTTDLSGKGRTVRMEGFSAKPEGEISSVGLASLVPGSVLSTTGITSIVGMNPGVDYFGTPSTGTRLFVDDPVTQNTYGPIVFGGMDPAMAWDRNVLRAVTVGANGAALQQNGNLSSGRLMVTPEAGVCDFAASFIDVDRSGTKVIVRFADNSAAQTFAIPVGPDNQGQFFGWSFDRPISQVEIWLGDFNSADGVTIGTFYTGTAMSIPTPGAAAALVAGVIPGLGRRRRSDSR